MAKGVLYCMTTVVPGLIKIGKTTIENFENRMYSLERNGYSNVVGLKRHFAIEYGLIFGCPDMNLEGENKND